MILILFIIWVIKFQKTRILNSIFRILYSSHWFWLILAWLAVGLAAVFVSPDKWAALGHWRAYFLEPILLLIVFLDLAKRDRFSTPTSSTMSSASNTILFGLSISAIICSLWAIGQKIFGGGMSSLESWQYPLQPIWRSTGFFPHPSFLGLFLGPLTILFLGKSFEFFKSKKLLFASYPASSGTPSKAVAIFYFLVFVLSVFAIIFARSEGAILGVGAGLIFLLLLYLKKRPRLIFVTILLLIGAFLLFFSPWQKTIWQKIAFQDLSLQMRLNIWRGAVDLIKDHPIFGAGLRGYQKLISQYQQPFSLPDVEGIISNELHPYPHNLFLAIWAELGILGLIVFLLIIFKFFLDGFRKIKNQNICHLSFVIWI
jgi:O-antigen ligase